MSKEQWQSYFPEDTTYDDDGSVRNCSGNFYNGSLGMYITKLQSDNERLQRELNALRPNPDHDAAIAAGDGTLHGAIDYWQGESDRLQKRVSELEKNLDKATSLLSDSEYKYYLGESNE